MGWAREEGRLVWGAWERVLGGEGYGGYEEAWGGMGRYGEVWGGGEVQKVGGVHGCISPHLSSVPRSLGRIDVHVHACMQHVHACIRATCTCMHTCNMYMHAYVQHVPACIRACIHACTSTYIHACISTYIHACMHACMHTSRLARPRSAAAISDSNAHSRAFRSSLLCMCMHMHMHMHMYICMHACILSP